MSMIMIGIGVAMLVASVVLLRWAMPKAGKEKTLPNWLTMAVPMTVLVFGILGITLIAKGFLA
jgi:hypothetical protein